MFWQNVTFSEFWSHHLPTLLPPLLDVKSVNDGDGDGNGKDSTEKIRQQQLVPVEPRVMAFLPPLKADFSSTKKLT